MDVSGSNKCGTKGVSGNQAGLPRQGAGEDGGHAGGQHGGGGQCEAGGKQRPAVIFTWSLKVIRVSHDDNV